MVILKIISVVLWYVILGLLSYLFYTHEDPTFQPETLEDMEKEYPGYTKEGYWMTFVIVIVLVWPILLVYFLRGFFMYYYRSLIDIFSKKGANNETHGKNQEDTGKEQESGR